MKNLIRCLFMKFFHAELIAIKYYILRDPTMNFSTCGEIEGAIYTLEKLNLLK